MSLPAKIWRVLDDLQLDLSGRTVLTEAATGAYVVTSVIAALAGAKVYAYTRSTRYGTVAEVTAATMALVKALGIPERQVMVVDDLPDRIIAEADVITNSGHLRPLNEMRMRFAKSTAVVALMYEAWELRADDLDLDYLKSRGIRVAATNERHPDVDVFSYLGELAVLQIHLAGLSLTQNRFVLYCNNPFGPYLARTLAALCAELIVVDDNNDPALYTGSNITWAENLEQLKDQLPRTDIVGIVLAAYPFDQEWIGTDGLIHAQFVSDNFPEAILLRFAGHVDESSLRRHGIGYYPSSVPIGHMGSLLSELGPDPVIRLQAASLKAAEVALTGGATYRGFPILEWL